MGSLIMVVSGATTMVMGPALAEAKASGENTVLLESYRKSSAWMAFGTLLMAGLIGISAPMVLELFGSKFRAGEHILYVFLVARAVMSLLGPNTALLVGAGHVRLQFALTGIALATGIALVLLEVARLIAVSRMFGGLRPSRQVFTCISACSVAAAAGFGVRALPYPPLVTTVVAAALFSTVYLILCQAMGLDIMSHFRSIVSRGRKS
jgi:O-antigen/teichoic acid export membrane protein